MPGTIKPEIQDQFLLAVADYNKSQSCYTLKSIPGDRNLTFLQNVTPMYAAKNAPTIMYTLQEIPDMADKVMDWNGQRLTKLAPKGLLAAANVGGKQVGASDVRPIVGHQFDHLLSCVGDAALGNNVVREWRAPSPIGIARSGIIDDDWGGAVGGDAREDACEHICGWNRLEAA